LSLKFILFQGKKAVVSNWNPWNDIFQNLNDEVVKSRYQHLNSTKIEGIHYWRKEPRNDLPDIPAPPCKQDENYNYIYITERHDMYNNRLYMAVESSI
jgi:hypothetical protein